MTPQKLFLSRLGMLAKACDFQLSTEWVALYDRALKRFGYDRAAAAVEAAIMERRGNERMPSIGDLVQRCSPAIPESDTAVEVSGRIIAALAKLGRYARESDVRDWVGEVGWYVIGNCGGWNAICSSLGTSTDAREISMWKAQLRDQAAAALRRHKAGILGLAPTFGEGQNNQRVAALVGQVLKNSEECDGSQRNAGGVSLKPGTRQHDAESDPGVTKAL